MLTDNGYASEREVKRLSSRGMEVLVAVASEDRRRNWDFRPRGAPKPDRPVKAPWPQDMDGKMRRPENRKLYRLRKQTVEPVFGIMKHGMGFGRFLLRGKEKVETKWELMALAYNCKRLYNLMRA